MNNLDELWANVVKAQNEEQAARREYEKLLEKPMHTLEARREHEISYVRLINANNLLNQAQAKYNTAANADISVSSDDYP